jgi:hypothetical protein
MSQDLLNSIGEDLTEGSIISNVGEESGTQVADVVDQAFKGLEQKANSNQSACWKAAKVLVQSCCSNPDRCAVVTSN